MTANSENLRSQKASSYQRKAFLDSDLGIDKENIGHPKKAASVSRKVLFASETSNDKPRKHLDNNKEQALRPKGLQEVEQSSNKQGAVPKNSNHQLNETSGVNKSIVRKLFPIYDDSKNSESTTRTASYQKAAKPRRSPVVKFEQTSSLEENEIHKQTNNQNKTSTPENAYSGLSMEAAYNTEYMAEYVRLQLEINEKKTLSQNFLKKSVTPEQRQLIVKYLINSTTYYKYPSFILHQAVKIFDYYIDTIDVAIQELQISALAALWIALKKDLISDEIPEASTIIKLGGSILQGNKKLLIECEKKVLMSLNFEVSFADPFSMLALYIVMIDQVRALEPDKVKELYYCGCYLMDLSLLDEKILTISAIHLAAISAEIAFVIYMGSDEDLKDPQWLYWRSQVYKVTPIIEKYCLPESQVNEIRNILLQKAVLSNQASTDYHTVYKKYSKKRYGPVSKFVLSKISSLIYINKITDPAYGPKPVFF